MLAEKPRRICDQTFEEYSARLDENIGRIIHAQEVSAQAAARVRDMLIVNQTVLDRLRWVSAFKYLAPLMLIPGAVVMAGLAVNQLIAAPAQWASPAGLLLGALLAGGAATLLLRRRNTDADAVYDRHLAATRTALQDGQWLALLDEGQQAALREAVVEQLPWARPLLPPLTTLEQRLRLIAWFQPVLARRAYQSERLTPVDCVGPALLAWLDGIISATHVPMLLLILIVNPPLPGAYRLIPGLLTALLLAAVAGPVLASHARVEAVLQHWLMEIAGPAEKSGQDPGG